MCSAYCLLAGRLLCDTYLSARELVREVDYTLATLSRTLLNQERQDLAAADVPGMEPPSPNPPPLLPAVQCCCSKPVYCASCADMTPCKVSGTNALA